MIGGRDEVTRLVLAAQGGGNGQAEHRYQGERGHRQHERQDDSGIAFLGGLHGWGTGNGKVP